MKIDEGSFMKVQESKNNKKIFKETKRAKLC